jgi:hypothetical protein
MKEIFWSRQGAKHTVKLKKLKVTTSEIMEEALK